MGLSEESKVEFQSFVKSRNERPLTFAVGDESFPYVEMSDDKLIQYILEELDTLFDGKASAHYIKHIFHNWNNEPYINSAYVSNNARWQTVKRLGESVDGRLFFCW